MRVQLASTAPARGCLPSAACAKLARTLALAQRRVRCVQLARTAAAAKRPALRALLERTAWKAALRQVAVDCVVVGHTPAWAAGRVRHAVCVLLGRTTPAAADLFALRVQLAGTAPARGCLPSAACAKLARTLALAQRRVRCVQLARTAAAAKRRVQYALQARSTPTLVVLLVLRVQLAGTALARGCLPSAACAKLARTLVVVQPPRRVLCVQLARTAGTVKVCAQYVPLEHTILKLDPIPQMHASLVPLGHFAFSAALALVMASALLDHFQFWEVEPHHHARRALLGGSA